MRKLVVGQQRYLSMRTSMLFTCGLSGHAEGGGGFLANLRWEFQILHLSSRHHFLMVKWDRKG